MKPRIIALAAAAAFGVTSTFALPAVAVPTTAPTTPTPNRGVTVSATNPDDGCMLLVTGQSVVPTDLFVNGVQSYSIAPASEAPPFRFEVVKDNGVRSGVNHVEILGKDGRSLAQTTARANCKTDPRPSPTWGWPKASFKGRMVTVANVKPGWTVHVTAMNTKTDKSHSFRARAKSGSAKIQLTGLPNGTYDFWISAGDLPANESYYPGIAIGSGKTAKPTPTRTHSTGLANTGI